MSLNPAHTYLTVNDALPALANAVLNGEELGSRKGERVLELLHQQITLTEPWDRYITLPLRKASLPAQIAETMWVLSGRSDIEWLSYYLPRAAEFSDDGKTWSGGYGPRLRYAGVTGAVVDQLDYVVRELRQQPTTRRAVMSIWDPMRDSRRADENPSRDVPCNDMISFQSRLGRLHMHVFVRSNDLLWGWSGINAFEWSMLQEVVAGMLGIDVGALTFSVSSLHAYDRHWKRLNDISEAYPDPTTARAEGAFDAPRLTHDAYRPRSVEALDAQLRAWMRSEYQIRQADTVQEALDSIPVALPQLFQEFLRVIAAARFSAPEVVRSQLLQQALRVSAPAPFALTAAAPAAPAAAPAEEPAAEEPTAPPALGEAQSVEELARAITALHSVKHAAYGDSWKRRGEQLGILANIARKVDRLGRSDDTETALDTVVDLLVYLAKYRCWLYDRADIEQVRSEDPEYANDLVRRALRLNADAESDDLAQETEQLAREIDEELLVPTWAAAGPLYKAIEVNDAIQAAAQLVVMTWKDGQRK